MPRTVYYVATALDGHIATDDDSLDWLFTARSVEGGPPGYDQFIADVGAIAMGSTTYRWILDHTMPDNDPSRATWPYKQPTWVFTHHANLPRPEGAQIILTSDDVTDVHPQMTNAANGKNLWVMGGGDLAGQFADAGLLDELIVAIAPVTLGRGAPLLPRRLAVTLEDVVRNGDFACLRYTIPNRR